MPNTQTTKVFGPAINRVADVMAHSHHFAFKGVSNLARDAGISPSSLSRLINGKMNPSFLMVARITGVLEKELGFRIDPRDLIAEDGRFLTKFVCELTGCHGCLPECALDEFGSVKQAYQDVTPGSWVTSRHPKGYMPGKDVNE